MLTAALVIPIEAQVPADQSHIFSISSVLKKLKQNQNILIIDVRPKTEFEKFRIPGSVNMPLYAVKTTPFLKSKTVILVNNGFHSNTLERECVILKKQGFKAYVLNGGLNLWKQENGPLEGDPFAQKQLNKVTARDLFQEKENKNLIVIDASDIQRPKTGEQLPSVKHLPGLKSLSPQYLEQPGGAKRQHPPILILNNDGHDYGKIEKTVRQSGIKNVFYLEGGMEKYSRFLHHLALSRVPKGSRVKTVSKCPRCGEKDFDTKTRKHEKGHEK